MITVTFVQPNGDEYTYDAEVGDTLMDVAVDLLDYALGRNDRSRLACQIRLAEHMDGLVVEVPSQQG